MARRELGVHARPCACGCGQNVPGMRYPSQMMRYIVGHSPVFNAWPEEEKQFLIENYERMTSGEIAKVLNRSRDSVASCAVKLLGLRKGGKRRSSLGAWFEHYTPNRPANGCWEWTGSRSGQGYGSLTFGRKFWFAHRLSMYLASGGLPEGMDVLHHCDNPPCVNPAHLYFGTDADNQRDRAERCRNSQQRFTPQNVLDIRRRFASGAATKRQLADEFGTVTSHIHGIVTRRSWRWLSDSGGAA